MGAFYEHLMAPGAIGTLWIRNRIVHAPMSLSLGAGDGTCGERFLAYYEARAKGGVGLINIGTVSVGYPEGAVDSKQIALSHDRFIPSIAELAERVQKHGAKIMLQLNHNGPMAGLDRVNGRPLAVPSIPKPRPSKLLEAYLPEELEELSDLAAANKMPPDPGFHVLETPDIQRIIAMFAHAALRAQKAGVDAIEIHGGHGYLLQSFLSPASNFRDDEYGGPIENRARFLLEVIRACRDLVGPDFSIVAKIDAAEFGREDGETLDDALWVASACKKAGATAITVTAFADMSEPLFHSGAHTPDHKNLLVPYARTIRSEVGGPVMTAGNIDLDDADRHIAEGAYDFVALGRKLLADPDLPNHLSKGQPTAVRPCIDCYVCLSQAYFRRPICCVVNPDMGRELEARPQRTSGRVAIVGAGPKGMETARLLAQRGANVILLERETKVGGHLSVAARLNPALARLEDWLQDEIERSGVEIITGIDDGFAYAASLELDSVIDATAGPRPDLAADGVLDISLSEPSSLPSGAIAILGSGAAGLHLAKVLASRPGASVTIFDSHPKPGRGLALVRRWRLLSELRDLGVAFRLGLRPEEVIAEARATSEVIVDSETVGERSLLDAFAEASRLAEEHCDKVAS